MKDTDTSDYTQFISNAFYNSINIDVHDDMVTIKIGESTYACLKAEEAKYEADGEGFGFD